MGELRIKKKNDSVIKGRGENSACIFWFLYLCSSFKKSTVFGFYHWLMCWSKMVLDVMAGYDHKQVQYGWECKVTVIHRTGYLVLLNYRDAPVSWVNFDVHSNMHKYLFYNWHKSSEIAKSRSPCSYIK